MQLDSHRQNCDITFHMMHFVGKMSPGMPGRINATQWMFATILGQQIWDNNYKCILLEDDLLNHESIY